MNPVDAAKNIFSNSCLPVNIIYMTSHNINNPNANIMQISCLSYLSL